MSSNTVTWDLIVNSSTAIKNLNKFSSAVDKVVGKTDKKLDKLISTFNKLNTSVDRLDNNKRKLGITKQLEDAERAATRLEKSLNNINSKSARSSAARGGRSSGGGRFFNAGMGMLGGLGMYGGLSGLSSFISTGANFEATMTRVRGITNESTEAFVELRDVVKDVGIKTTFTLTEMAGASKRLAMSGLNSKQVASMLPNVAQLAQSGDVSLDLATDYLTGVIKGQGWDINKATSQAVADMMTGTATSGSFGIKELGQSMSYVGGVSSMLGVGLDETFAMLSMLADRNLVSGRAGRNLSAMLTEMYNPSNDEKRGLLSKYNIVTRDSSGLKDMPELIKEFSKMSTQDRLDYFGKQGDRAFEKILSGGTKEFEEKRAKIMKSGGKTKFLSDKFMETLLGRWQTLLGTISDLSIEITSKLAPAFIYLIDGVTSVVSKLSKNERFLEFIQIFANSAVIALKGLYEILKVVFNFIMNNWEELSIILAAAGAAFVAFKIVAIASMIKIGTVALVTNPFTPWLVTALAVVSALGTIASDMPNSDVIKDDMKSRVNMFSEGGGKAVDAVMSIIEGKSVSRNWKKITEGLDDMDAATGFYDKFKGHQESKMTTAERRAKMLDERTSDKPKSLLDEIILGSKEKIKGLFKGTALAEIFEGKNINIDKFGSKSSGGILDLEGGGSATETMSSISPLTSSANEMSRSVVVRMDNMIETVNINGHLGEAGTEAQIEEKVAEVFIRVVKDFELGLSN